MNDDTWFPMFLMIFSAAFAAFISWGIATHTVRKEAVDAGVAYFQATEYGDVKFKWKEDGK